MVETLLKVVVVVDVVAIAVVVAGLVAVFAWMGWGGSDD
jgi:hypothetical protein